MIDIYWARNHFDRTRSASAWTNFISVNPKAGIEGTIRMKKEKVHSAWSSMYIFVKDVVCSSYSLSDLSSSDWRSRNHGSLIFKEFNWDTIAGIKTRLQYVPYRSINEFLERYGIWTMLMWLPENLSLNSFQMFLKTIFPN